jgi:hypothetical protein
MAGSLGRHRAHILIRRIQGRIFAWLGKEGVT